MKTGLKILGIFGLGLLLASGAYAADVEWTGAGDGNWNDPANWSSSSVPGTDAFDTAILSGVDDVVVSATPVWATNGYSVKILDEASLRLSHEMEHFEAIILGPDAGSGGGHVEQYHQSTPGITVADDVRVGDNSGATSDSTYAMYWGSLSVGDELYVDQGMFEVNGNLPEVSAQNMTLTADATLRFDFSKDGISTIELANALTIASGAKLEIDLRGYRMGGNEIELVTFGSISGAFDPADITITGLGGGSISYDGDSLNLTVVDDVDKRSSSLWFRMSADTETESENLQVDTGHRIRNLSSPSLSYTQASDGDDLIYSISWTGSDFDGDGANDVISYDLRVESFAGSTYSYRENEGDRDEIFFSSITELGTPAALEIADGCWGVEANALLDAGETLRYSVENLQVSTGYDVRLEGFVSTMMVEERKATGHQLILGEGGGLEAVSNNGSDRFGFLHQHPLLITSAQDSRIAIEYVTVNFTVSDLPDTMDSAVNDYSTLPSGPLHWDDYPAETNFINYPEFSWDVVARVAGMKRLETYDQLEPMVAHHQILGMSSANLEGLSLRDEANRSLAAMLKAIDPDIITSTYLNSGILLGGYTANETYDYDEWAKYTLNKDGSRNYGDVRSYIQHNHAHPGLRKWWVNTAKSLTMDPNIDMIFIDKATGSNLELLNDAGEMEPWSDRMRMYQELAEGVDEDVCVRGNTLRNRGEGGGRPVMNFFDGSYLESWRRGNGSSFIAETRALATCGGMQLMREAALKGKILTPVISPDVEDVEDRIELEESGSETNDTELVGTMEQIIDDTRVAMQYPLAIHLIMAEKYSYFTAKVGGLHLPEYAYDPTDYIDELHEPLGPPLGPPVKNGYIYTRSFEHVDVWMNVATEKAELIWDWMPIADSQNLWGNEESSVSITLTGSDPQDKSLTYAVYAQPTNGVLTGTAPDLVYTPNPDFIGEDSFTFKAYNDTAESLKGTVSITVENVNQDAPYVTTNLVVYSGANAAMQDIGFSATLPEVATDPDGDRLTYSVSSDPSWLIVGPDGTLDGTPSGSDLGINSWVISATDSTGLSSSFTLEIFVYDNSVVINTIKTNSVASGYDVTGAEAAGYRSTGISKGFDGDGDDVYGTAGTFFFGLGAAANVNGKLFTRNTPSLPSWVTEYAAGTNFSSVAEYTTYDLFDDPTAALSTNVADWLSTAIATATSEGGAGSWEENMTFTVDATAPRSFRVGLMAGNSVTDDGRWDPTGFRLSCEGRPVAAEVTGLDIDLGIVFFDVSLTSGATGTFLIEGQKRLNSQGSSIAGILFDTVSEDAPVALAQSVSAVEDTPTAVTLTGSDTEGAPLTYGVVNQPARGVLSGTAPDLLYTPGTNYIGADSFTFFVNDGTANSAVATVSITVTAGDNDAPVAQEQWVSTCEETAKAVQISAIDPEWSTLMTYAVVTPPAHGVLSGTAPNLIYTPEADFNGVDWFTFTGNDGDVTGDAATIWIRVMGVNDAPVAQAQSVALDEDVATAITLTATDLEEDPLRYTVLTQPAHGVLSGTAPNLIYTPEENYTGADQFTFMADDFRLDSAAATVSITVVQSSISSAGSGSGYDVASTEATAFRSTGVVKGFDADSDNVYGTAGTFFFGQGGDSNINGQPFSRHTDNLPEWVTDASSGTNFVSVAENSTYTAIDDPTLLPVSDVADWPQSAICISALGGVGTWSEMMTFTIDASAPSPFRVGIMAGNEGTADGRWDPTGLRLSVDGGTAVAVTNLSVMDSNTVGMVFFDVPADGEGVSTFLIEGQQRTANHGASIAGITFDVDPAAVWPPVPDIEYFILAHTATEGQGKVAWSVTNATSVSLLNASNETVVGVSGLQGTADITYTSGESFTLVASNNVIERTQTQAAPSSTYTEGEVMFPDSLVTGFPDDGLVRRDPSDIIKVGDTWHVWITRSTIRHTGDGADIWHATSTDEGQTWTEQSEAIARGSDSTNNWDYTSALTANILVHEGTYYLYYTGTPLNWDSTYIAEGIKAIGVATASSPYGPWTKYEGNPILRTEYDNEENEDKFDNYLIDDPSLAVRDGNIWLYYKGRYRGSSPTLTQMGVAVASDPLGPFIKQNNGEPVQNGGHEVQIWLDEDEGVYSLVNGAGPADLIYTIQYAADGLNFSKYANVPIDKPDAPGLFRPELTDPTAGQMPEWGVEGILYISRFEVDFSDLIAKRIELDPGSITEGNRIGDSVGGLSVSDGKEYIFEQLPIINADAFTVTNEAVVADTIFDAAVSNQVGLFLRASSDETTVDAYFDIDVLDNSLISPAGSGSGYDVASTEAAAFRSTGISKSYDIDGDNAYGTAGYYFYGNGVDKTSNSDGKPSWVSAVGSSAVTLVASSNYADFDNPTLPISDTVADWDITTIGLFNTDGTTGGLWAELMTFTVDASAPRSFRLGVMAGNEDTADGRWDPAALRVSFDGGSPVEVSGLGPTILGMAFFNVTLQDDVSGTFSIEGQNRSLGGNTKGPSIAGITFDVIVNQAPVADAQSVSVDEDSSVSITLSGSDIDGDSLTYTVVTQSANGTLTGTVPNLTYTPAANYNGADSFTYKANDGAVDSAEASVSITVTAVNDAPVATAQSMTTPEDTAKVITLTGSDADGDSLTYSIVTQPAHGSLSGTAPNVTYTPAANYHGADSFTFKVNDGTVDSAAAMISITANAVNDAPVFSADPIIGDSAFVDIVYDGVIRAADADADDTLTYSASGPAWLIVAPDGALSGTPSESDYGLNVFTVTVVDALLASDTTTLEINVLDPDDLDNIIKVVGDGLDYDLTGSEVTGFRSTGTAKTNDTDGDDAYGTAGYYFYGNGVNDNSNSDGKPSWVTSVEATNNVVVSESYTDFDNPTESIAMTVSDWTITGIANVQNGTAGMWSELLAFSVDASAPQSFRVGVMAGNEDTADGRWDPVGLRLSFQDIVVTEVTGLGTELGLVFFDVSLPSGFTGTFSVEGQTRTGKGPSIAGVTFDVIVNQAPVADAQSVSVDEDSSVSITLSGSDIDGDSLTYTVVTQSANGTLTGTVPNLTYTPAANYNGADSFTYKANDGAVDSAEASVSITVTAVNDAPVATAQSMTTPEDTAKVITLTGSDADGDSLTYSIVTQPAHGSLSGTAPNVTYTPAANYHGADSFTFKVNDGTVDSAAAMISITANAVNDAPVFSADPIIGDSAFVDIVYDGVIRAADADADDTLTYSASGPAWLIVAPDGALSGTPSESDYGLNVFTVTVVDALLASDTTTLEINVLDPDDLDNIIKVVGDGLDYDLTGSEVTGFRSTGTAKTNDTDGDDAYGTAGYYFYGNGVNDNSNSDGKPSWVTSVEATNNVVVSENYTDFDNPTESIAMTVSDWTITGIANVQNGTAGMWSELLAFSVDASAPQSFRVGVMAGNEDTADGRWDPVGLRLSFQDIVVTEVTGLGTELGLVFFDVSLPSGFAGTFSVEGQTRTGKGPSIAGVTFDVIVNQAPVADAQSVSVDEDSSVSITLSGSDIDGDSLTYTVVTQSANGTLTGTVPNLTYTPAANYNGADSFTYKANDGTVDSAEVTVSITVNAVNDAPVADAKSEAVNEDGTVAVTLTGSDVDGDNLTYAVTTAPANGSLSGTAPALTYTPDANYNGSDLFTYTVNDGTVDSAEATVSITVDAVNDAPIADAKSEAVNEDGTVAVMLTGSDVDGDSLTYAVVTAPVNGVLSGTAPNLTYTPDANYNGSDSFTYTVNDGTVDSAEATVSITVDAVNDAPIADAKSEAVNEDGTVAVMLTGSDVDGDSFTYAVVTAPVNGVLSGTAPNLTYTPDANYNGSDSFTYTVSDGTVDSAEATVSITVDAVNDTPVADDIADTTRVDLPLAVTLTGSDVDGDSLTFAVVSQPANGVLSGSSTNLVYTPAAGFAGEDSFTYTANDGTDDSPVATVTIAVSQVIVDYQHTAGSAVPDSIANGVTSSVSLDGTGLYGTIAISIDQYSVAADNGLAPDEDQSLDHYMIYSVVNNTEITFQSLEVTPYAKSTDRDYLLSYIVSGSNEVFLTSWTDAQGSTAPDMIRIDFADFTTSEDVEFRVYWGGTAGSSAQARAYVDDLVLLGVVNEAPVADDLVASVDEDDATAVTLTGSDANGDSLTFAVATGPANGSLSGTAPDLTYTPNADFNGADSFTYTVNDGTVDSAAATVSITVNAVNDAPVATAQSMTTPEDTAKVITLTGSDADGDSLTYSVVTQPAHGSLSGIAPNLTYTPSANYNGADSFTFKVNDGMVESATATVSITVEAVNDAPVADAQSVSVDEDDSVAITLSGSDIDGDPLSYLVTQPSNGSLSGAAPNLTYTPAADFNGTDSFTYTVNDGTVDSAEVTVSITVNAAAGLVAYWALDDGSGVIATDSSGHGFDGTISDGTWTTGVDGGALDFDGSSSLVTLPAAAFTSVSDQITIAMWVYGDTTQPRNDSVFYATDVSGNRILNIHLPWSNSSVYWDAGYSAGYDRINKAAASSEFMGEWNHWVFTKNATTGEMSIYLNGSLWHTGTGKVKTMSGITNPTLGGSSSYSYDGMIDDVQLYNVALDETEVAALYTTAGDSIPELRVAEYYLTTGDFSGTTATVTLDQDLADDYYILMRGSRVGDGLSYPDNNYARVTAVPNGLGELATSGAADEIQLGRYVADMDWEGVVTVVECVNSSSAAGFKLVDIVETSLTGTSGTDTSAAWNDASQVVLFGGYRGGGASFAADVATRNQGASVHARLYPSGTSTLNWSRDAAGETLVDAVMTTFVIEWGSEWDVQHVNVAGSNGGASADATGEYTTASISSVSRPNSWVWATGTRVDAGIGDCAEACLVTLGDGVSQNATESSVAVGSEYTDAYDFDVYVLTHPAISVDYRFVADGNQNVLDLPVTVDATTAGARFGWIYNGVNGTGDYHPRNQFWARYTGDSEVTVSRGFDGQNFPAWVQGIDLSGLNQ